VPSDALTCMHAAVDIGRMWNRFSDWLENGPPSTPPPLASTTAGSSWSAGYGRFLRKLGNRLMETVQGSSVEPLFRRVPAHNGRGVTLEPSISMEDLEARIKATVEQVVRAKADQAGDSTPLTALQALAEWVAESVPASAGTPPSALAALGAASPNSVAQLDEVQASPAASARSERRAAVSDAPTIGDQVFTSCHPLEYFGSALAVGDWDGDGHNDMLVTAYGYSNYSFGYTCPVVERAVGVPSDAQTDISAQIGAAYIIYGSPSACTDLVLG